MQTLLVQISELKPKMFPLVVAIGHIKSRAALECRISLADLEYQPDFLVIQFSVKWL